MTDTQPPASITLFDAVDKETKASILQLNRNLREVVLDLESRIDNLALESDKEASAVVEQQLRATLAEVNRAIATIKSVVDFVLAEGVDAEAFLKANEQELSAFRDLIHTSMENILKIKKEM